RGELVANLERCQVLAERVHTGAVDDILTGHAVDCRAAVPLANHSSQVIRAALNCGALHVVQDAADTAELLTTASTTRATVDQGWQWGTVAGGSLRIHAVQEMHAAVVGSNTAAIESCEFIIVSNNRSHQ